MRFLSHYSAAGIGGTVTQRFDLRALVRARLVLSLVVLLSIPQFAVAAPRANFSLNYNKDVNTLDLRFSPAPSDGECNYLLYASSSKSKLKGNFRGATLLAQIEGGDAVYSLHATSVPYFFRKSRRSSGSETIYLRAVFACESGFGLSERVSMKVARVLGQGFATEALWYQALRAQLRTPNYSLRRVFSHLSFTKPLDLQSVGDNRIFVAELGGKIWAFLNDQFVQSKTLFLDISTLVRTSDEQGLLGFAFHPNYFQNGFVFVHYCAAGSGDAVIARYRVSGSNPNEVDPASAQILLQVPATPFQNHKGGQISFGPDGYLYIALGDGGSVGDPLGSGQNLQSLLGKILRIDVDASENDRLYAIPGTNPFKGNSEGMREEIYAYGFRNPWRFSFDPPTQQLWVADVGQDAIEEIDIVENGKNYGWNSMEGNACYPSGLSCNPSGLSLPYFQYLHSGSAASVTGGFVYRGTRQPELAGKYLYGDFVSGQVWAVSADGGAGLNTELLNSNKLISSFGRDSYGEVFMLSYGDGAIYSILSPGAPVN